MRLITSSKGIKLPLIYFVEDESEIIDIPIGIPFIRGSSKEYKNIVQTLEFEILLKSALETGLDFNWIDLLKLNGFTNVVRDKIAFSEKVLNNISDPKKEGDKEAFIISTESTTISDMVSTIYAAYVVDLEVLKNLEIIPTFLADIEKAIEINIHNGFKFNSNLYNKKLGLPIGELELSHVQKNLIIIDISSSIPKSISNTILALAKTMSSQYYADLLITGSKSTLYEYEDVDTLDTTTIYDENGTDNDQVIFKSLLESEERIYDTVIVFGDNHSPCQSWSNKYNGRSRRISIDEGKELCKWTVNSIISFHTTSNDSLAGYADWFTCDNITYMKKWVTYFN